MHAWPAARPLWRADMMISGGTTNQLFPLPVPVRSKRETQTHHARIEEGTRIIPGIFPSGVIYQNYT